MWTNDRSKAETRFVPVPRQLVIAFEAPQLWMMQPPERQRIVSVGITTPLTPLGDVIIRVARREAELEGPRIIEIVVPNVVLMEHYPAKSVQALLLSL